MRGWQLLLAAAPASAYHLARAPPLRSDCRGGRIAMGTTADFKVGLTIEYENSVRSPPRSGWLYIWPHDVTRGL